jgi:hypothetical protein
VSTVEITRTYLPGIEAVESPAVARSAFVDLARAFAILMMLQGHTLHVVLASDLRTGLAYDLWSAARGLTSGIFLLLSGFVFALAAHRDWAADRRGPVLPVRRLRRWGLLLLVGYALHFPADRIANLWTMSDERWQSFFVVDVLQCIAITLLGLQLLLALCRTPRRFMLGTVLACAAVIALTPTMWRIDWSAWLPGPLAPYMSSASGSPFPLFPWSAYTLSGAILGGLYVQWSPAHARFANRVLIGGGLGMLAAALVGARIPLEPFGPTDASSTSPLLFLWREGLVLIVLGGLAHASRFMSAPSFVVRALAHESLTVYAVHLCLVYGSLWNDGLRQHVGPTQSLWHSLGYVAAVSGSMACLAMAWHWFKHRQPRAAGWVRVGVGGLLFSRLL